VLESGKHYDTEKSKTAARMPRNLFRGGWAGAFRYGLKIGEDIKK